MEWMTQDRHVRIRSEPGNNTLPLTISAMIQPTDHTSTEKWNESEISMQQRAKKKTNKMKSDVKKSDVRHAGTVMSSQWGWSTDVTQNDHRNTMNKLETSLIKHHRPEHFHSYCESSAEYDGENKTLGKITDLDITIHITEYYFQSIH